MCRTLLVLLLVGILSFTVVDAQNSTYPVITPENADQLRQVGTLGRGLTVDVRYADNDTIETVSYGGLWRYDADNLNVPPQWVNIPQPDPNAQYSPDGRWLLTLSGELWDVEQQTYVRTFDTFSERAEFSQDSSILAYYQRTILPESDVDCLQDNSCMQRVILWDTAAKMRRLVIVETDVTDVELVAHDTLLAVIQHEQTTFYDVATGEQAFIIPASLTTFSPDGTKAVAIYPADEENGVLMLVWDLGLQTVVMTLTFLPEESVWNWQFNDTSTLLAISTVIVDENRNVEGGAIAVWDIAAANQAAIFPFKEPSFGFAFSPDNRYLATLNYPLYPATYGDPTITVFNLQTFSINTSIPNGLWRSANAIAFRPDSSQLAIAYPEGRLLTIDTQTGTITGEIAGYGGYTVDTIFTDEAIMTISDEAEVWYWHPETFAPMRRQPGCNLLAYHESSDKALCFYPYDANPPVLQNLTTGEVLARLPFAEANRFAAATFRPDGQQFATLSFNGTVQLWNANTGALQTILQEMDDTDFTYISIAYIHDGQYLAAGASGTIWNVETGESVNRPSVSGEWHGEFVISETGNWFAQSIDNHLYIWRLTALLNGEPANADTVLAVLPPELEQADGDEPMTMNYDVATASPDGRLLVVARPLDGFVIFDMETFTPIANLPENDPSNLFRNNLVRFSDDGRLLITGDGYYYGGGADESPQIGHARVWAVGG